MNDETLAALRASIRHWEENVEAATPWRARLGITHCALCLKFYSQGCVGCPVSEKTNKPSCRGTPYEEARTAHNLWQNSSEHHTTWKRAAEAELAFLRSLLPDGVTE